MNLDLRKINVLVAEDIFPMQIIMRDILRALGIGEVTLTSNGKDAYHKYSSTSSRPDIIISDWQMPEMDGIELIRKIRTDPNSPNRTIPIIMMTGYTSTSHVREIMDSGATEFIAKPFTSKELAKRIAYIIKNPRDFIVSPNFVGPCRRRRKNENYANESKRKADTIDKIPAKLDLQQKVGLGEIDSRALLLSQKIIDENKIDFVPIAMKFLLELEDAVALAKSETEPTKKTIERIYNPIMQIKANGIIFKYNLVGNLAKIALEFLDKVNELDEIVIAIIEAHTRTLRHLLEKRTSGDGGETGATFEDELTKACGRYMAIRSQLQKKKLETLVKTKT